jgi:hypothetical protein
MDNRPSDIVTNERDQQDLRVKGVFGFMTLSQRYVIGLGDGIVSSDN